MGNDWRGVVHTATSRRMTARAPVLAVALLGTMWLNTAAADSCIRFYNRSPDIPVLHVSFDTDPAACPTGTCWQADVPRGEMREYCPGRWVYPLPYVGRQIRLVFSQNGNFWADRFGLLGNTPGEQSFLCEIVAEHGLATRGCGSLDLRDKPW